MSVLRDGVRLLLVVIGYLLLTRLDLVAVNKCHLCIWLIWTVYWFRSMDNHLTYSMINVNMIAMNVTRNERTTSTEYILYNCSIIALLVFLSLSYSIKRHMGKSYDMRDFNLKTNKQHELVTTGLFRYVRHPMYTCSILATFTSVIATYFHWISLVAFIVSSARFFMCIPREEKVLSNLYKTSYKQYQQRTPYKLIPYLF